jgi:hypothetical protein
MLHTEDMSECTYKSIASVEVEAVLSLIPIPDAPRYSAWRLTRKATFDRDGESFATGVNAGSGEEQGIALTEDIHAFARGEKKVISVSAVQLVSRHTLALIAQHGWEGWEKAKQLKLNDPEPKPYTCIASNSYDGVPVYVVGSSHLLFDINRRPLPVGQVISYIGFGLDNSRYDLDKAAEILKKRTDIEFLSEDRWHALKPGEVISPIPSYNAERGRDYQISFRWTPSAEDMGRIYDECVRMQNALPAKERKSREKEDTKWEKGDVPPTYCFVDRWHAMYNIDIFGLKAGEATLCKTFYESIESEDDPEDDEEPW